MNGVLSLYIDSSEPSTEEFNQIIDDLDKIVWNTLTREEAELVRSLKQDRIVTLYALEGALDWPLEKLTSMKTGKYPVPRDLMIILRLLHKRVREKPELARKAVLDYLERESFDTAMKRKEA